MPGERATWFSRSKVLAVPNYEARFAFDDASKRRKPAPARYAASWREQLFEDRLFGHIPRGAHDECGQLRSTGHPLSISDELSPVQREKARGWFSPIQRSRGSLRPCGALRSMSPCSAYPAPSEPMVQTMCLRRPSRPRGWSGQTFRMVSMQPALTHCRVPTVARSAVARCQQQSGSILGHAPSGASFIVRLSKDS